MEQWQLFHYTAWLLQVVQRKAFLGQFISPPQALKEFGHDDILHLSPKKAIPCDVKVGEESSMHLLYAMQGQSLWQNALQRSPKTYSHLNASLQTEA
eukprot:1144581-Pelagomonas_calceolata.AAC.15